MAQLSLTTKVAETAIGPTEIWDTRLSKFGLRVRDPSRRFPKGKKTWQVMTYDPRTRRKKRIKLGDYPIMKIVDAREKAAQILEDVELGVVPLRALPLKDFFFETYITKHCARHNRIRTIQEKQSHWKNHIEPQLGNLILGDVKTSDIAQILDSAEDRGAQCARSVFATLRHMFNIAVDKQFIETSPVTMRAPIGVKSRERVLSHDEIKAVWNAAEEEGFAFGSIVQMLFLTGQRRTNVGTIMWSELSDDTWIIPAEKFKAGREHLVPLSGVAQKLVECTPHFTDADYLFFGDGAGATPYSGYSKAKSRLDKKCGVTGWRLHDIRRTVASEMQRIGIPPYIIEVVEGRVSGTFGGVTGTYQRYTYEDEKREALEKWSVRLGEILKAD